MNRLRKRPAYAGALRLLDVGETKESIFPPEPPLLFLVGGSYVLGPKRPGQLGGEKGRCWDTYIQSLTPSPPLLRPVPLAHPNSH
jgi:hypothetical protein